MVFISKDFNVLETVKLPIRTQYSPASCYSHR